ncbi:MAG: TonB-dependent receptor [Limisphaerales bacterium]
MHSPISTTSCLCLLATTIPLVHAQSPNPTPQTSPAPNTTLTPPPWNPASPIRIGQNNAYLDLGLVGTMAAGGSTASDIEGGTQAGGHDPYQRGFNLQGLELNLRGAVDPYFRANANLLFGLNSAGESYFELEEAWAETVALPANLQLRAGQIFTDFGRHNPTHLHSWSFVDNPLINARFLGPDGLRNPGARISWLAPTPFYSELSLGIQNSDGSTVTSFRSSGHLHGAEDEDHEELPLAYRHTDNDRGITRFQDLLLSPRYSLSFDLTDNQTVLLGTSATFGPNSRGGEAAGDTSTQIYGVDLTWKWKSPRHHGGFPFVQWQTEAMLRKYDAGSFDWDENANGTLDDGEVEDLTTGLPAFLPGETLTDYGFYTQVIYGFRKGWVAGLRLDWTDGDQAEYEQLNLALDGEALGRDPLRNARWRLSPNLTYYPSEFSKIRLQYNYDDRKDIGIDHSVWLQFEFLLGAHAAHTF